MLPALKRTTPTVLSADGSDLGAEPPAPAKRTRVLNKGVSFASAVKIRVPVAWSEQREAQFEIGIDLWLSLMKDWGNCRFLEMLDAELPGDLQRAVVSDIFRGKAPSALLKRGRAIANFQYFLADKFVTFPCLEKEPYAYLKKLEGEGAPKSRCSGLLEALAFVRHVVGVEEIDYLLKSRRCRGIGLVEEFKESKQAPALTVDQLLLLHLTLEGHAHAWTRHFAGCALIATYSRCRWSDIQHSVELIVDRGSDGALIYLELRIGVHKTCRLQSKRHRFLHVVSPSLGLKDFGELWLASRRDIGMSMVLRVRGIDSEEATSWLRLIFRECPRQAIEPSSKSFKATVLSWAAKRGVDGLSNAEAWISRRGRLGHRLQQGCSSPVHPHCGEAPCGGQGRKVQAGRVAWRPTHWRPDPSAGAFGSTCGGRWTSWKGGGQHRTAFPRHHEGQGRAAGRSRDGRSRSENGKAGLVECPSARVSPLTGPWGSNPMFPTIDCRSQCRSTDLFVWGSSDEGWSPEMFFPFPFERERRRRSDSRSRSRDRRRRRQPIEVPSHSKEGGGCSGQGGGTAALTTAHYAAPYDAGTGLHVAAGAHPWSCLGTSPGLPGFIECLAGPFEVAPAPKLVSEKGRLEQVQARGFPKLEAGG